MLPDKVEKSYFLFHRDYHRWYSLSGQRNDEVVVFPTWTTEPGGDFASTSAPQDTLKKDTIGSDAWIPPTPLDCSPHGAGASQTDNWADPRESVEVRLLLIFEAGKGGLAKMTVS